MSVDPTLKRFIAKAYLGAFGDVEDINLEEKRRVISPLKINTPKASHQDYFTPEGLQLRAYTPPGRSATEIMPAVIYIPGTALIFNRLIINDDYCSLLTQLLSMRVISISYRLAPEYPFPLFLDDCVDSIAWIAQSTQQLHIDPERITLWGESSGGTLSTSCTHILRDRGLPIIRHHTIFYPRVDLTNSYPSHHQYEQGYLLDKPYLKWLTELCYRPDQCLHDPLASPLFATNFAGLPPTTLITAECDPLRDEGEAYAQKLQQANVPVTVRRASGLVHGFMRFYNKVPAVKETLQWACDELKSKM
jgi:acetyl esterase